MKTTLLFLLMALPIFAQDGFVAEKGKIVWEHTFAANTDIQSILEAQEKITISNSGTGTITGKAEGITNDIYANSLRLESDANFDFSITKSEIGYSVRVTSYIFLEKCGPLQMRTLPGSLEKYYLEYGKIRKSDKTKSDLAYLDSYLTRLFSSQTTDAAPATAAR